jgi:hypothetical protein
MMPLRSPKNAPVRRFAWPMGAFCVFLLGGCGESTPPTPPVAHDPVMTEALQQPLLADPDLSQTNARNLAIVPPGPADTVHPVVVTH